MRCEKAAAKKALWLTATGTQTRGMPTGTQTLPSELRHVNSQKDLHVCVGKTTWYRILQRRAANCLMHRSEKPDLNGNLWLDWTGQRGLPTWLSGAVPDLNFMLSSAFGCTRKLQSCYSTVGHTYNMLSSAAEMSKHESRE